jgi:hypothetical protein
MDDDFSIEALGLEIAGMDVHCLLRDMDEIELAVSELALYRHFYEHFKEGFDLIHHAVFFWLEGGRYVECAESTIQTMFRLRDPIEEHFSFAEATSLPSVIRQFVGTDHPASDSQLIATYALVQAVQAVEVLANWLFDLELGVYGIEVDLVELLRQTDPKEYVKLVEKARDRTSGFEIRSREDFAVFKADADKALMLASLYRQIDDVEASQPSSNAYGFMRKVLANVSATQASQRGKIAGKGNSNPESDKQQAAKNRFDRVCSAADRHVSADPKISGTDLIKAIVEKDKIASIPTVRKYLHQGGYLPR